MKFFFLIFLIKSALSLAPTENFTYNKTLIAPDLFTVFWKHDSVEVTFEIHFKNSKWAMFGIAGTNFSDVVIAWLNDDRTGHFSDQRLMPNNDLILDSEHNWMLVDAFQKDETKIFKFKRFINLSCKSNSHEDLNIGTGLIKIVFSTGRNSDPVKILNRNQLDLELLSDTNGPYTCPVPAANQVLNSKPSENYANIFQLIPGVYNLYWNYTDSEITFEVHCKTSGWVGFGFSPNGGMDKSDVVVGWISGGKTNFTDRHIQGRSVIVDQKQDWHLLKSYESDGISVFKFKRSIKLCDAEDSIIDKGTPNVIFAFGEQDPLPGQDISYHQSNRGSTKINLITSSKVNVQDDEPDSEVLDITIQNLVLPKQDTYYYCKGFRVPKNLTQKRHIYKYEFIFPEINYQRMHHSLLYECEPGYDGEKPKYEDGECYTNSIKGSLCQVISLGWAVGGENVFYFPKDAGYPMGGDTDYSYLVLELHYDNPNLDIGFIEKASLRFHLTKKLRQKELGVLTLGTDPSLYGIAIPPKMDRLSIKNYCFNDCLNQVCKINFKKS
ncbi:DBH-like monooxygenase 2 -like protein [Brachionus plicatilis]|uniref:DBH-like monooxygenase 2-like protein n=1 Tax=Brachionus plicatilis TaxID=10195 RepID=A0A3M7S8G0_BRAPC|nr:DBH-like monooxygenase 2 -like protein [Brachionus plicatilis]